MFGIKIKARLSTLVIIGLFGLSAGTTYLRLNLSSSIWEPVIFGLLVGLITFLSVLVHELSHSIVANKNGLIVDEIEFFLFGGVAKISGEPEDPKLNLELQ
jgi:Zn-dependent protease